MEVKAATAEHRDSPPAVPCSGPPSQRGRSKGGAATWLAPTSCSWLGHPPSAGRGLHPAGPRLRSVPWMTNPLHNFLSQDRTLRSLDVRPKEKVSPLHHSFELQGRCRLVAVPRVKACSALPRGKVPHGQGQAPDQKTTSGTV